MTSPNKYNQRFDLVILSFFKTTARYYKTVQKRVLVFSVFVLLSSILWLFRVLEDSYVSTINYPVRYLDFPANKILSGDTPNKLKLSVRGSGYSLLSNKLRYKTPLNFSINNFSLYSQSKDSMSVYILTRYAQEALSQELTRKRTNLEIVSISPDTIFFSFTRTLVKKVPVVAVLGNQKNIYSRQHKLNGKVYTIPDSLEITGPANLIDTINQLYTQSINPTELDDTFRQKANILGWNNIAIEKEKVNVVIPVDRYTELSYRVVIRPRNVPDSLSIKLFPREATLYFNVTHSQIPFTSESDFKPFVDYSELKDNLKTTSYLTVKIDSLPEYASATRIYPTRVEYINERKHVTNWNNGGNR
ncbi:MAG: YbbR-like domain-containing protein [Bacteroidota bacterium]|nr:MAG: YbbR-like domain-containing protein [Bacteroidota bacterium]